VRGGSATRRAAFSIALACLAASPARARDYGQQGTLFRVLEPDFLASIESRLRHLEASGAILAMNRALAARTERKVNRPDRVHGVGAATRPRSWTHDPAIVIDHDIADARGQLIARQGQRINPLDFVTLRQKLVFIDGDVPAQVTWALARHSARDAKIVLVNGAPLAAMTRHQRRFYFDQGGLLVARFGIHAVPALAEQSGRILRISEIPVIAAGRAP
jgi:conjugal transfer pilus assembly protein TraW